MLYLRPASCDSACFRKISWKIFKPKDIIQSHLAFSLTCFPSEHSIDKALPTQIQIGQERLGIESHDAKVCGWKVRTTWLEQVRGSKSEMRRKRILNSRWVGSVVVGFLVVLGTLLGQVPASSPGKGGTDVTELDLKTAFAFPGVEVAAPIYLTPGDGVQVGSLKFDVTFSNPFLSFARLELTSRRLQPIADKSIATWGPAEGKELVVSVEIANERNNKALPEGPIGRLVFMISSEAPAGQTMLDVENLSVRTVFGEQVLRVRSSGSTVTILDPAEDSLEMACFFYMH